MNHRSIAFAVYMLVLVSVGLTQDIRVVVNGRTVRFGSKQNPYYRDGTWVIPARAVLDAARVRYDWDAGRKRLTVLQANPQFSVRDGSDTIELRNGSRIRMRANAELYSGELHVPELFLSRALNVSSDWDRNGKTLYFGRRGDWNDGGSGDGGWGGGGGNNPWYGEGGNTVPGRPGNTTVSPTAGISMSSNSRGTGRVSSGRQQTSMVNRAQVILDRNGSAEVRIWTDRLGTISMKGRYDRVGQRISVDLRQGSGRATDRLRGTVQLSRDLKAVSSLNLSGSFNGESMVLDFRPN